MTQPATGQEDSGHLLPDDAWAAVVAGARERAATLALPPAPGRFAAVDRTIPARVHGGNIAGGPRLGVLHSAETPLRAGYAYSIAANWFATKATTSATVMIDPAETVRLLPDDVVAYHAGPAVNGYSVGVEQAGYARFGRDEWLTVDGRRQMRRVAQYMVDCQRRWGIPLRWATDAQVRAARTGDPPQGWCTHDTVRRVLAGTTHTDPGGNYPHDELMDTAVALATGATLEDEDMPLTPDDIERVAIRTRDHLATGANPWGLDALLTRLVRIETLTIAADVNDSPDVLAQKLVPALVPLLVPAVADAMEIAVAGGGITDRAQLEAVVESGVRRVLGSLG